MALLPLDTIAGCQIEKHSVETLAGTSDTLGMLGIMKKQCTSEANFGMFEPKQEVHDELSGNRFSQEVFYRNIQCVLNPDG
ncbi:MAG: hypothetical protein ACE5JF_13440, partial [Anaerolineales bacterium]